MLVDGDPARRSPARIGGHRAGGLVVAAWSLSLAAVATSAALLGPVRGSGRTGIGPLRPDDVIDLVLAVVLVTIGALIVLRGRSATYGWLVLWTGATLSLVGAAGQVALHGWYVAPDDAGAHVEVAVWAQDQWMLFFAPAALLLPALFPDGTAVGRWRRPVRLATAAWIVLIVLHAIAERPAGNIFDGQPGAPDNPTGILSGSAGMVSAAWLFLTLGSLVISVGSLRTRWVRADRDQRQQLKWVLLALGLAAAALVAATVHTALVEVAGADLYLDWLESVVLSLSWVVVALALGLGVLRFRLYDVDLVINRMVVYALMSVLVIAAYGLVVVGSAALLPDLGDSWAALVATGLVALVFAPVRAKVQAGVNRLMFGRRSDPYGVVTELGDVLASAGTPDTTLATVVETVATALKLPGVAIEVEIDGRWERRAVAGDPGADPAIVPLRYQGELVGRLVAARRSPTERLHADDLRLLDNVAHHVAALAQAVDLNRALQRSREELVLAREEERRRLRRDLHDGLGPSLASQTFRLDAVLQLLGHDSEAAAEQIRALKEQNRELVADIRRLVYELRPPALDELGLAGALAAHAGQLARSGALAVSVRTDPDPLPELPAAVEAAAYRIATEAITNVVRHASATTCTVTAAVVEDGLTVRVLDDGVGVWAVTAPGVGMSSMRERAGELGGTIDVSAARSGGTVVTATLPIAPRRPAPPLSADRPGSRSRS